jgi:predicted RNA-binding Zn-ribbon protein involved in translation (DUF1610 family)
MPTEYIYRVLDVDSDGDPLDHGVVEADSENHALDLLHQRFRRVIPFAGTITVRLYLVTRKQGVWEADTRTDRVLTVSGVAFETNLRNGDYGKCPQCGSRTWIEETIWHWMHERWEFTIPNEDDGRQLTQDGNCDCTYHCAACGWAIPEGTEGGGGTSSWDEFWDDAEDDDTDEIEENRHGGIEPI